MAETAENRPVAIQVSGVKKMYKLGQIGGGTLQADLQSWWARKRGKEDPNSKIGEGERSNGDTFMALNGIDLTIYQGEAVGIIGSNGAGKSTLLKLLSRVTAPTEGEIDIYGRIASMLEVGTGFNGELTGRENVYMNGAILGMTKAEIDAKMEEIIEFSEVREFIDTPVKRYSSGMFVKLAFSVAAHLDAEIMIMDEVLAVGDMAFQKKCLTKMREAAKRDGRTVLYVSHNMSTIRQLCERCIVLKQGKVIFEGDVGKAISCYLNKDDISNSFVDYINYERDNWFKNNRIRLQWVRNNNESNQSFDIERTEKLKMQICIKSIMDISCVGFRFELRDDTNTPVGSSNLYDLQLKKGNNCFCLEYSLDMLAPGKYNSLFTIFTFLGDKQSVIEDWIPGILFEVYDTKSNNKVEWNRSALGPIMLPEPNFYR